MYLCETKCRELALIILLGAFRSLDFFILILVCVCVNKNKRANSLCGVNWIPLSHEEASQCSFLASFIQTYIRVAIPYISAGAAGEGLQKVFVTIDPHKDLFKYTRLAFGVAFAPALFQRTMENLL